MFKKIGLLLAVLLIMGCKTVSEKNKNFSYQRAKASMEPQIFAKAVLEQKSGSTARGEATFSKTEDGILVHVVVDNVVPPGLHGIHIHENGDCSAPDAMSAGPHYNPVHLIHGSPDPRKFHLGDLGNITVGNDGRGVLNLVIPFSHFNPEVSDWTKIIGRSVILHSKADDLVSQPAGDSGSRIACGVITAE